MGLFDRMKDKAESAVRQKVGEMQDGVRRTISDAEGDVRKAIDDAKSSIPGVSKPSLQGELRSDNQVTAGQSLRDAAKGGNIMNASATLLAPDEGQYVSYDMEIVGESNYQQPLRKQAASGVFDRFACVLEAEMGNQYDKNAIAVWCGRGLAGYLSRGDAEEVRPLLLQQESIHDTKIAVYATLIGGQPGKSYGLVLCWPEALGPWSDAFESQDATGLDAFRRVLLVDLERLRDLKRAGELDQAESLAMDLVRRAEAIGVVEGTPPPPGYTMEAAIIRRKRKDYSGEVAVLERYLAAYDASPEGRRLQVNMGYGEIEKRLSQVRELREKHR